MSHSDITLIDEINDYTTLAANLTIIGTGPTGKLLLTLGKATGSFLPLGALQEGDKRLKHAFELLYEMKEVMDIKTHDVLQDTYETWVTIHQVSVLELRVHLRIIVARNSMDFSAKRFASPVSLYKMIAKIYMHKTESTRLDKNVIVCILDLKSRLPTVWGC